MFNSQEEQAASNNNNKKRKRNEFIASIINKPVFNAHSDRNVPQLYLLNFILFMLLNVFTAVSNEKKNQLCDPTMFNTKHTKQNQYTVS